MPNDYTNAEVVKAIVSEDTKYVKDNLIVFAKNIADAYVKATELSARAARVAVLMKDGTLLMSVFDAFHDQPKVQAALKAWAVKFFPLTFKKDKKGKERFKFSQEAQDKWPGGFNLDEQVGAAKVIGLNGALPKKKTTGGKSESTYVDRFSKLMKSMEKADDMDEDETALLDHLRHADAMSKDFSLKLAIVHVIRQGNKAKNKEALTEEEKSLLLGLSAYAKTMGVELA